MYLLFLAFRVGSQINFEHQLNQEPTNSYRSILGFFKLDQTKTEIFEIFVYRRNFKTRNFPPISTRNSRTSTDWCYFFLTRARQESKFLKILTTNEFLKAETFLLLRKISTVITMGWVVCMNNVQKFFWLWVWQEIWISLWTRYKGLL